MKTFTIVLLCIFASLTACKKDEVNTLSTKEVTEVIVRVEMSKPYQTNGNSYCSFSYGSKGLPNFSIGTFYINVGTEFTFNAVSDRETLNIVFKTTDEVNQGSWHFTEVKNVTVSSSTTIKGKVISTKPYIQFY